MDDRSPEQRLADVGATSSRRVGRAPVRSPTAMKEGAGVILRDLPATPAAQIAPTPWLYADFLLHGEAAVLGGKDGVGKGAITVAIILSIVTGRALLGETVWRSGRVAILTYEDSPEVWRKRIAAACIHYDLDYAVVMANIRFIEPEPAADARIVLLRIDGGNVVRPHGEAIARALYEWGAVLLVIDPLNHAHEVMEGNSNVPMALVANEITRIARVAGVAVLVLHHLRKGAQGDADDLMGATSIRATFRTARILARMTEDEAKAVGESLRRRYVRIADTKQNYSAAPEAATWFKLIGIPLRNGTDRYPEGDNIVVATAWTPTSPFEGLSMSAIVRALDGIESGMPDGERYSSHGGAKKRSASAFLAMTLEIERDHAVRILAAWLKESLVIIDDYDRPGGKGEKEKGLRVDTQKLAAMRAQASE